MPLIIDQSASLIVRSLLQWQRVCTVPSAGRNWPCYVGVMPDGANNQVQDNVLSVFDLQGIRQGRQHRGDDPVIQGDVMERYAVQVQVRCTNYEEGWKKIADVSRVLDFVLRVSIKAEHFVYTIPAIQRRPIVPLGMESGTKRRFKFSVDCNFAAEQRDVTTPSPVGYFTFVAVEGPELQFIDPDNV